MNYSNDDTTRPCRGIETASRSSAAASPAAVHEPDKASYRSSFPPCGAGGEGLALFRLLRLEGITILRNSLENGFSGSPGCGRDMDNSVIGEIGADTLRATHALAGRFGHRGCPYQAFAGRVSAAGTIGAPRDVAHSYTSRS